MHINKKLLLLQGVGFKFKLLLNKLCLVLGYSHIIKLSFSNNIKVSLISNKLIELNALNLYSLNYYIYTIKKFKKLDVYKGKGILLGGEEVLKKEGKKATF
jgi:large subunit ribosomal protein L6